MQKRRRGHLRLHDHLNGLWQHLIGIAFVIRIRSAAVFLFLRSGLPVDLLNDIVVIIGVFLPLNELHHRFHLVIREEASLNTHRLIGADRAEEHIAVAKQLLRAGHVKNRA